MLPENNNVKTPDTEAEKLLRKLVSTAFPTSFKDLSDYAHKLSTAAHAARWYLEKKDACEFVEENGVTCNEPAVRVSFSIPCCEGHAKRRDRSLA